MFKEQNGKETDSLVKNAGVTGREEVCGRQVSTYHWCKG